MHQEWMKISQAYVDSNRALAPIRLWRDGRKRDLLPSAIALLLILMATATLHRFAGPLWTVLWPVICVTGFSVLMQMSANKLAVLRHPVEYAQYNIARQPFSTRIDFLAYALFRKRITQFGYTPEQLKMIADYSETLSPPPKPFLINQHFVTVILISVLVGLFNAYLQKTAYWAALGWLYIWAVASTTILAGLILDGIRTAQARDIQVRRFLKRAQIELEYSRVGEVKLLAPEQQVAEDTPSARPSKASV